MEMYLVDIPIQNDIQLSTLTKYHLKKKNEQTLYRRLTLSTYTDRSGLKNKSTHAHIAHILISKSV